MEKTLSVALGVALVAFVPLYAHCETYRVGPDEKYTTLSQVAARLGPGDTVLVTGDIVDSVRFTRSGSVDKPITVRGVTRVENGRIIRPRITPPKAATVISCDGDHYVLEGLEITGIPVPVSEQILGILHNCDDLVVRNCYIHHLTYKPLVGTPTSGSITIEFCEIESCTRLDIWSWGKGSQAVVRFCYFHDMHDTMLKSHAWRNVICYNWFENTFNSSIRVLDQLGRMSNLDPSAYPMHTDIVGNVFIQGWSPGVRWAEFSLGAEDSYSPGIEGDFTIAHNLFITTHDLVKETGPSSVILVHGNVDHVKLFSNVFLDYGVSGTEIYTRGEVFDSQRTREFIKRRGTGDPIVEGANNWISVRAAGIPPALVRTLRGISPKFVDLLNGNYHPRADSPLANAGMWPLPGGQVISIVPEFEPQKGIPVDLKPRPRRKAEPPSIGPFEVDQ
jgi:hypothetical protein